MPYQERRQQGRRQARTRARTHALFYSCRYGSSHVYQQRCPPDQDAAGLSVIGRDFGSPGEREGAGRERVVKLTAGDRRKMGSGEAFALPRPGDRGVSQGPLIARVLSGVVRRLFRSSPDGDALRAIAEAGWGV